MSVDSDHETPAIELHVMLALLSTGPVGISDKMERATRRCCAGPCRATGHFKPGRAVTAIDATFTDAPPDGEVSPRAAPDPRGILSASNSSPRSESTSSTLPAAERQRALVTRRFRPEEPCKNGADAVASGCVEPVLARSIYRAGRPEQRHGRHSTRRR